VCQLRWPKWRWLSKRGRGGRGFKGGFPPRPSVPPEPWRRREAEAGQFASKWVRAKFRISHPIELVASFAASPLGTGFRQEIPRGFAGWLRRLPYRCRDFLKFTDKKS